MLLWCRPLIVLLSGCAILFNLSSTDADLIKLKNGGELHGKLQSYHPADAELTMNTLLGTKITLARDEIQFFLKRSLKIEQYELRALQVADTIGAHWELSEWCRENRLTEQRDEQLQAILLLDPDHEKARAALGYTRQNGEWMTRHELMTQQGYVRYKGKYITPQELELIEKTEAQRDEEKKWYKKIRLWQAWLMGRNRERAQLGLAELQRISEPHAIPALNQFFSDHDDRRIRLLFVDILQRMGGPAPVSALARQALHDVDRVIRSEALSAIDDEFGKQAVPIFKKELQNDLNVIVRRAGAAMGRLGSEDDVPDLIDALVTTHKYRVRVPDNSKSIGISTDGNLNPSQGALPPDIELQLRTGQLQNGVIVNQIQAPQFKPTKVITINYEHQNPEVRAALKKITSEDFGYEERAWRLWWLARKNGTIVPTKTVVQ